MAFVTQFRKSLGTLDPNSTLFTLSHLQTLNLSFNYFLGSSFSPQFGMLTNLRVLDLTYTYLDGDVPLQISHLSKLVSFHLSYNSLSFSNVVMNQLVRNLTNLKDFEVMGTNLSNITPSNSFMNFSLSLHSIHLSCSELSGNFPYHILCLPNLRVLELQYNFELNGRLPMSNWSKSLEILDLSETNFSGGIPISIGEVKALRYLDLSSCNFNGEIPESIENLELNQLSPHSQINSNNSLANVCSNTLFNLTHLDLRDNSLTGGIPTWLYMLPTLTYLDLSRNHLSGFMRDFRSNSLESLDLSHNNFQGQISNSIYSQLNLFDLGLESNNFSGIFNFHMLGILPNLSYLDISHNTQLSIFSTNVTSSHLRDIYMASLNLEEIPYFLRNQKCLSRLDLSNNRIGGKIPEWFSELGDRLYYLNLSHNLFSSGIELLFNMHNLRVVDLDYNLFNKLPILMPSEINTFSVSNNKLRGNVHPSICQATSLADLDLSNNNLSGALPSCFSNITSLEYLILKSNNFSGIIPIPPNIGFYIASNNHFIGEIPLSICHVLNLQVLSLSNNRMSGTIPPCLTNITSLSVLDLKGNNFSGTIPTFSSTTCQLMSLDLNQNHIQGKLTQSLLNCENLQIVDLGNNNITGHFPYWLKSASSLQILILRSNQFYGHINNSFDKDSFSNLQIIDISHNNFCGLLPSSFFKNLRAIKEVENNEFISFSPQYYQNSVKISMKGFEQTLETNLLIWKTIDMSNNDLNGEIPKEIGMLRSIVGLILSHNKLTGVIPTSISNLNNLEWLDLSSNELLGSIPPELVTLTFLSFLNLSQNHLSGPIPQGKQFNTFENSSYFGNVGLCGYPLPKCDSDEKDHKSHLLHEEEEEGDHNNEKGFWLKVVFIGYGFRIPFGVFIGYLVFHYGKPMWIVAILQPKTTPKIHTSRRRRCRPRK